MLSLCFTIKAFPGCHVCEAHFFSTPITFFNATGVKCSFWQWLPAKLKKLTHLIPIKMAHSLYAFDVLQQEIQYHVCISKISILCRIGIKLLFIKTKSHCFCSIKQRVSFVIPNQYLRHNVS